MTDFQRSDAADATKPGPAQPSTLSSIAKPFLASIVRHSLTVAAGALVAHGTVSSSTGEQLVGAGMVVAGLAWSWWDKRGRAQLVQALDDARALLHARAEAARKARGN